MTPHDIFHQFQNRKCVTTVLAPAAAAIANEIVQAEIAELGPGRGARPRVEIQCGGARCDSVWDAPLPRTVTVTVRMGILDDLFNVVDVGRYGILIVGRAELRYVRETNKLAKGHWPLLRFQRGVAAVEFALLAIMFFTLVFGVLELARAMFVINTVQEVTRRAAAAASVANFRDDAAMARIRQDAIFRNSPGELVLSTPVTDNNVQMIIWRLPDKATGACR